MHDITNGLTSVLNLLLNAIKFCFTYLDSFTFNGISLLDYIIAILILSVAVSVLVGLASNGIKGSERYMKSELIAKDRAKRKGH